MGVTTCNIIRSVRLRGYLPLFSPGTLAPHPRHIQQVVHLCATATPMRVPLPVCANRLAGQRRFGLTDEFSCASARYIIACGVRSDAAGAHLPMMSVRLCNVGIGGHALLFVCAIPAGAEGHEAILRSLHTLCRCALKRGATTGLIRTVFIRALPFCPVPPRFPLA